MRISIRSMVVGFVLVSFCAVSVSGQDYGMFTDAADIGEFDQPSWSDRNPDNGLYMIECDAGGIGDGDFSTNDTFHFIYREISGSFAIAGSPLWYEYPGQCGLMVRQSLDDDSPFVFIQITDGVGADSNAIVGTWRSAKGAAGMPLDGEVDPGTDEFPTIRLERNGNTFDFLMLARRDRYRRFQRLLVQMTDPVYVGIAVTGSSSQGTYWEFQDVELEEYPVTVERKFPEPTLTPGATLSGVEVSAQAAAEGDAELVVTEEPPEGVSISNIAVTAGTYELDDEGNIVWTLSGGAGESKLTYDADLPDTDKQVLIFRGDFAYGSRQGGEIGGDMILPIPELAPGPQGPYNIRPTEEALPLSRTEEVFIEAERLYPQEEDLGWWLAIDPELPSGVYAMETGGDGALMVEVEVKEAATYYVYGQVRGEGGNSDSLFVDVWIDYMLTGDQEDIWDIGGAGTWGRAWAGERDITDKREWELEPGFYTFMFGEREDGGKLDWIAITADGTTRINTIESEEDLRTRPKFTPAGRVSVGDEPVHIEAENASPVSGFYIEKDEDVYSGYISMADVRGYDRQSNLTGDQMHFPIDVQQAGTYYIFAKVQAYSQAYDSFYIGIDGDVEYRDEDLFLFPEIYDQWIRTIVTTGEDRTPRAFELSAGDHTINWHAGDRRAQLDWIVITDDPNFDIQGFDDGGGPAVQPTPTPVPPTPTPTPQPATPTPTPPQELLAFGFDGATADAMGIDYSAATGFNVGRISGGTVPSGPDTDGHGLIMDTGGGEGTLAILRDAVAVGSGPVLIAVDAQSNGPGCSLALAALNSPIDGQLGYVTASEADVPVGQWRRLVLIYDPPSDSLQPGLQVTVSSGKAGVTAFFDNLVVKELPSVQATAVTLDGDGSFDSDVGSLMQNVNGDTGTVDTASQAGKVVLSLDSDDGAANIGLFASSLQGSFPQVLQATVSASLLSGSGGVTALVMTNGNGNVGAFVHNDALPSLSSPITVGGGFKTENPAFPILCVVQNGGPGVTSEVLVDNLQMVRVTGSF